MNLGGDSNAEISFTIGQKNKKQILTKRGEVKMKTFKKLAAMGAAVMMMASVSAIGASATDSYSLRITNNSSITSKECIAGSATKDGWITTTVKLNSVAKGAGITYTTYVDTTFVGSTPQKITSTGSYPKDYSHYNIKRGGKIKVTVKLCPTPAGIGSYASGSVSGS